MKSAYSSTKGKQNKLSSMEKREDLNLLIVDDK